ncbi:hypothetical protein [Ruminococcus sp. Marseille-P6503]|uniref:hypothetical protein n=1 Tax=Ruminococcus sp. Marseille-P6503 TaxID=2364796 RepID=UPI000F542E74|nr:hypothetical protein [Ruminococcus sp. Marseille-P6503]
MIDVENEVFNNVAVPLREHFEGIYVVGENTSEPSRFPAVSIIEKSSAVDEKSIDSGSIENYADVMYEINVYSNLESGKKQQAKAIVSFINDQFDSMGFVRQFCEPIDNAADPTVYRMTARFVGKADVQKNIYRK